MKNILHLFKRDVQNVSRSVIGLVVVMGLIIVPCLYAWSTPMRVTRAI